MARTSFIAFSVAAAVLTGELCANPAIHRIAHRTLEIEGWTVHVDPELLEGEHEATGDLALRVLDQRLHEIVLKLPAGPVAKLREVPIYLDRAHPLGNAHYHPDGGWLQRHGYDPAMEKAVHFTGAASLIREAASPHATSVVLHELAHAYHDRVLGFDHPDILAGYKLFCDARKFDHTPTVQGDRRPHYGLTDHKEFFAEMTEAFFTGNNYFPFNHVQLHQEHRPTYDLIARIWGTAIAPPAADESRGPSILDLRILATLKSQRGDFDGALKLIDEAQRRDADREGRLADLRKHIEAMRSSGSDAGLKH